VGRKSDLIDSNENMLRQSLLVFAENGLCCDIGYLVLPAPRYAPVVGPARNALTVGNTSGHMFIAAEATTIAVSYGA